MNEVFIASTRNELEKLSGRKKIWMLPGIGVAMIALSLWGLLWLKGGSGLMPVQPSQYPLLILGWFTSLLLPLFIAMAGADVFAGEQGDRTIKLALLKPISRFKLYMSKQAALGIYIIGTLGVLYVLSVVATVILGGHLPAAETILAYGAAILPMLLVAFTVGFIAQFFKSGSGVMLCSILLFAASNAIGLMAPKFSDYLISSYLNWHVLFIGAGGNVGRIVTLFMFLLAYSIIMLTAGYFLFERKEI